MPKNLIKKLREAKRILDDVHANADINEFMDGFHWSDFQTGTANAVHEIDRILADVVV